MYIIYNELLRKFLFNIASKQVWSQIARRHRSPEIKILDTNISRLVNCNELIPAVEGQFNQGSLEANYSIYCILLYACIFGVPSSLVFQIVVSPVPTEAGMTFVTYRGIY